MGVELLMYAGKGPTGNCGLLTLNAGEFTPDGFIQWEWINDGTAGDFYFIVIIDEPNNVFELNETNNVFWIWINVTGAPITQIQHLLPFVGVGITWYVNETTGIYFTRLGGGGGPYHTYYNITNLRTGSVVKPLTNWSTEANADFFLTFGEDPYRICFNTTAESTTEVEFPQCQDLVVDNTPPETSINVLTPNYANLPGDNLNVSSTDTPTTSFTDFTLTVVDFPSGTNLLGDNFVGFEPVDYAFYRIIYDGNGTTMRDTSYTGTFQFENMTTGWDDGWYTIEAYSIDRLGHIGATNTTTVYLDNTGPETQLEIGFPKIRNQPTDIWNVSGSTTFNLTSVESVGSGPDQTTISYRITNVSSSLVVDSGISTTIDISTLPDGEYLIEYWSRDNLGNLGITNSTNVYVDNTPPTMQIFFDVPKYPALPTALWFITNATDFSFTSSDGLGVGVELMEFRIQGPGGDSGWQTYSVPTDLNAWSLETDGTYTISYRVRDFLGNSQSWSVDVILDDTPPVTSISVGSPQFPVGPLPAYINSSTPINLSAIDTGSGVWKIYYEVEFTTGLLEYVRQFGHICRRQLQDLLQ